MYTKKSLLRLAVCLAFVMTLLISTAAPSLATYGPPNNALVGTETQPANAAITKCLKVGQETIVPSISFTFVITKVSINGANDTATVNSMPTIGTAITNPANSGTVSVAYTSADVYNQLNNMTKRENQTDFLYKESSALFPASMTWPRAGIYIYTITEQQSTNYTVNTATETLTLSKAKYELHVYVAEKTSSPGQYYVWAIGAYKILNDEGTDTGGGTGNKVNPMPGGPGGSTGYLTPYSQMIFENKFLRHGSEQPPTNPNNDVKFKLSKAVTGMVSDTGLYFSFNVTIYRPGGVSSKTHYKAYVYEGTSTTPVNNLTPNTDTSSLIVSNYLNIPVNTAVTIKLKHGQYLGFTNIDAGAEYVINELAAANYQASYTLTKSGVATGPVSAFDFNQSLTTPTTIINIYPTTQQNPTPAWVDSAAFSNLRETITPTGITVNDMPYYALVVIGIAGLAGYLFFRIKVRKNDETAVEAS